MVLSIHVKCSLNVSVADIRRTAKWSHSITGLDQLPFPIWWALLKSNRDKKVLKFLLETTSPQMSYCQGYHLDEC